MKYILKATKNLNSYRLSDCVKNFDWKLRLTIKQSEKLSELKLILRSLIAPLQSSFSILNEYNI